jgi:mono/diheme cytochrome c family protein
MAATDQTYHSQHTLDIVFAVSCILMLFGTLWMFVQDYNRQFKSVQREFRDVEEAMNEQMMLQELPTRDQVNTAHSQLDEARKKLESTRESLRSTERDLMAKRALADDHYRGVKAEFDSKTSYYNIAVEHLGNETNPGRKQELQHDVEGRKKELDELEGQLTKAQDALDKVDQEIKKEITSKIDGPQQEVSQAEDNLKKVTAVFDRFAKTTAQKRWKFGDEFRRLPIVDAFESPTKIKQLWLPDLTIDYGGFKDVPRYDRCISCHLGIDRGTFDHEAVTRLTRSPEVIQKDIAQTRERRKKLEGKDDPGAEAEAKRLDDSIKRMEKELEYAKGTQDRLAQAREILTQRAKTENLGFDPGDLPKQVRWLNLTPGQIMEYSAHPRLDLFVDGNSAHPMEKFGCTICHQGQGSATDFLLSVHTPANATQEEEWKKEYGWESTHFWDFPMLSSRFTESSCLKCHHEVTDLIRNGSREEAPKLLRGYNLVRENGCFGCHEISSIKAGKEIGPDLRLEPTPALEYQTPADQDKAKSDPLNMPGTYRKVGPSLRRLAEKTNEDWVRKWIYSPRGFRPDTKMPHFYGLSTNNTEALPEDQKRFPDTEIAGITHYLMAESKGAIEGKDTIRTTLERVVKRRQEELSKGFLADKEWKELLDNSRRLGELGLLGYPSRAGDINALLAEQRQLQERLQELQKKAFALQAKKDPEELGADEAKDLKDAAEALTSEKSGVTARLIEAIKSPALAVQITDEEGKTVTVPDAPKDADREKHLSNGRRLFTEKGCLACHSHEGTTKEGLGVPAVHGEANFGPDLSRIAAKIAPEVGGKEAQRRWVIQWVLNPTIYHPRTRMPITHLSPQDASDVAEWLLSQKVTDWDEKGPDAPKRMDLITLARLYLAKAPAFTRKDVDDFLPPNNENPPGITEERLKFLPGDADERKLYDPNKAISDDNLKWYIGRKAINRLGCFGCHDVPGFETAKPIGTALNDWGKKDPDRIAFEDAPIFVRETHNIVNVRNNPDDPSKPAKDWHAVNGKTPYEEVYFQALEHHHREGFLHQKLMEPRSFDFHRLRAWDDRLRMPQFRFARTKQRDGESDEAYLARREFEEAEAREAVMVFILGLVAEPMPLKYLNRPNPDRLAEVKGHQVLEKFNCAGCHQVRSGVYEFKPTPEGLNFLQEVYQRTHKMEMEKDHSFQGHNAWVGPPQTSPDRMLVFGTSPRINDTDYEDRKMLVVRLTDALRFSGNDRVMRDLPAASIIPIVPEDLITRNDPWGGTFTDLMVQYLSKKDRDKYKLQNGDSDLARSTLPPPLIREGERVQPNWLYGFLLNPPPVRPQTYMQLRMPKFNMSGEEARALANYFSGVSRLTNPGAGVSAEYLTVHQRDEPYWRHKTGEYVKRLKDAKQFDDRVKEMEPLWQDALKRQIAEAEAGLEAMKQAIKDAQGEEKKQKEADQSHREATIKKWKEELDKKDYSRLRKQWEEEGAYAADAYRLVTDRNLCLQCHNVGDVPSGLPQGPNLALTAERLRPEWVKEWIANPDRLFGYKPAMPQNFPKNPVSYQKVFVGSSIEQVTAVRDVLMDLPRLADMPGNRSRAPLAAGGGK